MPHPDPDSPSSACLSSPVQNGHSHHSNHRNHRERHGGSSRRARPSGSSSGTQSNANANANADADAAPSRSGAARYRPKARTSLNEVFNRQDLKEAQRIGEGLRSLQAQAEDNKANLANVTTDTLLKAFKNQDEYFYKFFAVAFQHGIAVVGSLRIRPAREKEARSKRGADRAVADTQNGATDAKLFAANTSLSIQLARRYKVDSNAFDVDEFLIKVRARLGLDRTGGIARNGADSEDESGADEVDELDESLSDGGAAGTRNRGRKRRRGGQLGDWEGIGWLAAKLYRRVPGMEFMYGPLQIEHKRKTIAQRARKEALAPEQRPTEIITSQKKDGTAPKAEDTPAYVARVGKLLARHDPLGEGINFFRFVINPGDFGQSVENLFFVSFLIKEGRAGIVVKDDGELLIRSVVDGGEEEEAGEERQRYQGVMEFDMETWELAKKVFDIKKPTIPHREPAATSRPGANGWYTQ